MEKALANGNKFKKKWFDLGFAQTGGKPKNSEP